MSLRNQTFFCILVPIMIVYYTKLALEDYINSIFSRSKDEETREENFDRTLPLDQKPSSDKYGTPYPANPPQPSQARGRGKNRQNGAKQSNKQATNSQQSNAWQKQVLFRDLTLQAIESEDECSTNAIGSYQTHIGQTGAKGVNAMIDQIAQNFVNKPVPPNDKKLNSPTFTDSTDEPTPMSFSKQGRGFRFNMSAEEQEAQEGIAFDE